MTTDGKTDVMIHKGHHRATVEPLNDQVRKFIMLNINGVEPTGMYTIPMDTIEDTIQFFYEENFIVEVR